MAQCENCGRQGGMFDVKLYNMPNKQDKVLCTNCYQTAIRTGSYYSQTKQPQQQMLCSGCNKPISADFKMCPHCGKQVAVATPEQKPTPTASCSGCGQPVQPNFKVCPYCGKKVEAPKQQKKSFCPECGKKTTTDSKFCQECGAQL
jgi:predicted amidophosphoribosyltransferase